MKIGIMTFWWSEDNYGQQLQCYALQKYLRDAGHDVYLIRYSYEIDLKTPLWKKILKAFNPIELYDYLFKKIQKSKDKKEKQYNPREFSKFRSKYINQSEKEYCSYTELKHNPPEADVYIVGSDQVWNVGPKKCANRAYLLDFGSSAIKRIAYAASFGKGYIDRTSIDLYSSLLKKFDYISVREKSGIDICKRCGIENVEWVPDPTMLIDIDIYRSLYKNEKIRMPNKPYCLLYYLGVDCGFSIQSVYDWSDRMNLEVVYVTGNMQHDKFEKHYATITEWIYLVEHAEYVITNSYHCSVFSLLFNKNFGVAPLKGKYAGLNNRLETLFKQFGIEQRFIVDDIGCILLKKHIQWDKVNDLFKQMRYSCRLKEVLQ